MEPGNIEDMFGVTFMKDVLVGHLPIGSSARMVLQNCSHFKPCSDKRQNGFKDLKLQRCKFLQQFFTFGEHDCLCLKKIKHFRIKCLRRFIKIKFILIF